MVQDTDGKTDLGKGKSVLKVMKRWVQNQGFRAPRSLWALLGCRPPFSHSRARSPGRAFATRCAGGWMGPF